MLRVSRRKVAALLLNGLNPQTSHSAPTVSVGRIKASTLSSKNESPSMFARRLGCYSLNSSVVGICLMCI